MSEVAEQQHPATLGNKVTEVVYSLLSFRRMTQAELAKRMGVTQSTVSGKLNGNRNWTLDELDTMSGIFGVKPEIFLQSPREAFAAAFGVDGGDGVRHQGLEPRTRWFSVTPGQRSNVIELPARPKPAPAGDGPVADVVNIGRSSRVNNKPDCFKRQPSARNSVRSAR